jgi:SAM-dependent methyltransferase
LQHNILSDAVVSTPNVAVDATAMAVSSTVATPTTTSTTLSMTKSDVLFPLSASISGTASLPSSDPPYDYFPNRSDARVLIAGCGNSLVPFDMIQDGWTGGIVAVDFASNVIDQMKEKVVQSQLVTDTATARTKQPQDILDYVCADLTQPTLEYTDGSFDLIVVKGTFDAILCSDSSRANILNFIQNCVRLLSPKHGVLFIMTTGNPDNRLEFLEHHNELSYYWRNVSIHPLRNNIYRAVNNGQPSYVEHSTLDF